MARPTVSPAWATNALYAGGPDAGTATKVAPSAGRFSDGWRNDDIPPAPEQNYWQGLIGDWLAYFDDGGGYTEGDLAAFTGAAEGTRIRTVYGATYEYTAATPFTPDAFWVRTATGMGVGQWINVLVPEINLGRIVALGTVPGGWANGAPNTIDPKFIPNGIHNVAVINAGTDTTTDTTATTTTTGDIIAVAPSSSGTITIGTLEADDVIHCLFPAVALNTTGIYHLGAYVSEDNGATWIAVTAQLGGGDTPYAISPANTAQPVVLSFVYTVVTGGNIAKVRFKFDANGGGTTSVGWGESRIWVTRPDWHA